MNPAVRENQAAAPEKTKLDIRESGALKEGQPQVTERRLFMQLTVFTECFDEKPAIEALRQSGLECVLYRDANDARGFGVLWMTEKPEDFVGQIRGLLTSNSAPFKSYRPRPELTMTGRTYSNGREPDLIDWLIDKPKRNARNAACPWAVWYPLRRKPEFALLSAEEQGKILMEHAILGRTYGKEGFAHDVRLACHGLDQNDNEFVIGLVGPKLYPLSRIVQDMRKTQQTSKYIQSLGPFFVGRAVYQSVLPDCSA